MAALCGVYRTEGRERASENWAVTVEWRSKKLEWRLECRREEIGPLSLYQNKYLVAVSLRNKAFTNEWLNAVFEEISSFRGELYVTLVDTPYFQVVTALESDVLERSKRIQDLQKQRNEQYRRLQGMCEASDSNVRFIDWDIFSNKTPKYLKEELITSFADEGKVRRDILRQVRKVYPEVKTDDELVSLSNFFITEVPVLAYIYYSVLPGIIDVYPGDQAEFFWSLDNGDFSDELPRLSSLAAISEPHRYINAKSS